MKVFKALLYLCALAFALTLLASIILVSLGLALFLLATGRYGLVFVTIFSGAFASLLVANAWEWAVERGWV